MSSVGLPENYQEVFLAERLKKNERLAATFEVIGWNELAKQVRTDNQIVVTQPFDATKAWIEYMNRLVGVLIGIFVFLNMVFSFGCRNENVWIPLLGVFIFLLTGFQGWVGSLLVSTNLLPGFITFHMVLALLMVVLLIAQRLLAQSKDEYMVTRRMKWVLGVFFILLIPQIITGTLTREQVDVLFTSGVVRSDVGENLTGYFFVHRSYSWLLLLLTVWTYFLLNRNGLLLWARILIAMVLIEVLIGVSLVYLSMPVFLQPFHLLLGTTLFGVVFYLFLRLKMVKA
jgi:cytochrome c oxidase assembly protein subunit 15